MNGFLNIIKPIGMSSNAVLTKLKKQFHISKIGHLGTLDPLASGVLPVMVGKATKLFDYFLKKDKEYVATFYFGKETTTLDAEGEVINESASKVTKEQIEAVLGHLTGEILQLPPKFSAKNVNGRRAYELARENKEFTLEKKKVTIHEITLNEQLNEQEFTFFIKCSSGTYIRSIARDLGRLLDTYAYMSGLVRTKSGMFEIETAISLEDLLKSRVEEHMIPLENVLTGFEVVTLDDSFYKALINGVKIPFEHNSEEFLVYCKEELFGIGQVINGILKLKVNLHLYTQE